MRVVYMSEDKKYTAQEAAIAVLNKTKELLEKSELMKGQRHTDSFSKIKLSPTGHSVREDRETGHEKGVHTAAKESKEVSEHFLGPKTKGNTGGESAVGGVTGKRVDSSIRGAFKKPVQEEHKKKLKELKDMPKPNLPKSEEMEKSSNDFDERLKRKRDESERIKGVHKPTDQKGVSWPAGSFLRTPGMKESSTPKYAHKKVLGELKDMPKPNLPKSEEMDKKESGYEKGIHRQVSLQFGKQGQSPAGAQTEAMHNKPKASNIKDINEQVKGRHKEVLNQMKDIKPNLPKSEKMGKAEEQEVKEKEGVQEQIAPDMNPKEEKEGNNQEWGTSPKSYGTLKLAKFIGYIEAKRKQKKGVV